MKIYSIEDDKYVWDDGWYEYPSYGTPPIVVIDKLNKLYANDLLQEDQNINSTGELLRSARIARENKQYNRAIQIAKRVLTIDPKNNMALAVLCANLRILGRPKEALEVSNISGVKKSHTLLTTRAAAYCDLEMWAEAKKEIGQALAIKKSQEAFNVVHRIKANKPELYKDS